jgi:hypothetical protein
MKKFSTILLTLAIAASLNQGFAAKPAWEEVNSPRQVIVQNLDNEGDVAIAVSEGYIYVSCENTVTVKIFSILGQLISQETLKPGMHRIKLASRGIYILRAGSTTRRITL